MTPVKNQFGKRLDIKSTKKKGVGHFFLEWANSAMQFSLLFISDPLPYLGTLVLDVGGRQWRHLPSHCSMVSPSWSLKNPGHWSDTALPAEN